MTPNQERLLELAERCEAATADEQAKLLREAFDLFDAMVESIKQETAELLFRVQVVKEEMKPVPAAPSRAQFLHPEVSAMRDVMDTGVTGRPLPGEGGPPFVLGAAPPRAQKKEALTVRRDAPKVGRNDPCPCGSGKKYKKCHGA